LLPTRATSLKKTSCLKTAEENIWRIFLAPAISEATDPCSKFDRRENTIEDQGCQIFLAKTYQNGENIPNYHKMYSKAVKYCQMAIK
jgi:hypothetical protein